MVSSKVFLLYLPKFFLVCKVLRWFLVRFFCFSYVSFFWFVRF